MPSAIIINLIGFVESISVTQTLVNKRHQKADPNHELLGIGVANVGSAVSGGFAVTGGFSGSLDNFERQHFCYTLLSFITQGCYWCNYICGRTCAN